MPVSSERLFQFFEEVAETEKVFTFDDGEGYLVFRIQGAEVVPFWSGKDRVTALQQLHPEYAEWAITEASVDQFFDETLPMLRQEGIRVGINWSGKRFFGHELSVADLLRNLERWLEEDDETGDAEEIAP